MIKRTLYFGNPAYLSLSNKQLIVRLPEVEKNDILPDSFKKESAASIPIEDIAVVVLDNKQITITQALLEALLMNNAAVVTCDSSHMPAGLLLPLDVHNIQHERFKNQIESSVPLRKQLWQQTVEAKILNQNAVLHSLGKNSARLLTLARNVRSGDPENYEGQAASIYWSEVFDKSLNFRREREGTPPNNLLNYGYAIIRAVTARSLVGSGLLPTLGIHHTNKYNAYCLADDIMEPYRPYVDRIVLNIVKSGHKIEEVTTDLKKILLALPAEDVVIDSERSPLTITMQRTTASLAQCFEGTARKIVYPELN